MERKIRVVVWNEFRHEKQIEKIKKIYPEGMHGVIAKHLNSRSDIVASLACLDEPEHGLSEAVLEQIDVLIWWGHVAHQEVKDEIVTRVRKRVLEGMGIICLHSAHFSKIFKALMGTSCVLNWRDGGKERIWTIEPSHPIAEGIPEYFELPETEMYGERFDIPTPEKVIFISWYPGGEVFRSGCVWERGYGRIFYFSPGHEAFPIYYDHNVLRVITNAVRWVAPRIIKRQECKNVPPIEK
ncbi:MAG: ThuA domain-containing protein [Candidatus Omnitrophica bacterium]|nr:ThuA domain-containing protein [Candidatus Omnitrophota bacterium]MCM8788476.1 ThuA domain-containing protein [Candidatus Omnitrophota bacterium]